MKNLSQYKALSEFIAKNPSLVIEKNVLTCLECGKEVNYSTKEGIRPLKKHLETSLHLANVKKREGQKTLEETCNITISNDFFNKNLVEAFTAANIPLNKLQTPA